MTTRLVMKAEFARRICWGKPDSPQRDLCSICHGALSEGPLRMWKHDGSGAAFCDGCTEQIFESKSE